MKLFGNFIIQAAYLTKDTQTTCHVHFLGNPNVFPDKTPQCTFFKCFVFFFCLFYNHEKNVGRSDIGPSSTAGTAAL